MVDQATIAPNGNIHNIIDGSIEGWAGYMPPAPPAPPCVAAAPVPPKSGHLAVRAPSGVGGGRSGAKGKGARHVGSVGGPWACALAGMPPPPLTGQKRARAGKASVPIAAADVKAIKAERSARGLVALLPEAAAAFVLGDRPETIEALGPQAVAERLVAALACHGPSTLDGAASVLGRLFTFAAERQPGAPVGGTAVADFLASASRPMTAGLRAKCPDFVL